VALGLLACRRDAGLQRWLAAAAVVIGVVGMLLAAAQVAAALVAAFNVGFS